MDSPPTIRLDDRAVAALATGDKLIAVADPNGVVVGYYCPVDTEYAREYADLAAKAHASRPYRRDFTTAEVLARLEALEPGR